ncbi:serine hydrolase domain-containing protein [Spirosoma validum]|uniref:Beta-lactamase family protein n=1 Tax=Spirosoma validum TaxID=2771355 RepID=A0A927GH04_9BACT|nr:serine hydrolase domain-containing protein [Spirosoma validum]MBD2757238.1 beta-lactamase family protein [Spirosoma validum]
MLLTLGFLPIATAQPPHSVIQFDTLTKRINRIMRDEHTPGAQVLVFTKDSLLYKLNAGVMNLKTKAPVTDQSMFRLGSISKSFVAVSALLLSEKKQLDFSEELKKAAPEVQFSNPWEDTDPVRIVHLLEHTTGFDDWTLKDFAVNDPNITLQKGLDSSAATRHSRWRPGTFVAYCNSGPPVVARIIEKRTGQEFESFVQQHIFAPLGMKTSTFRRDGAALTHLVTNYSGGNTPREERYLHILERPAGSLNAPALELMSFVQLLMNRGTHAGVRLLDTSSIHRMETPTVSLAAKAGLEEGYGLHNFVTSYKGYIFHGHDGFINSGLAYYLYNTELNLGLIVLVNSDGAGFGKIYNAVLDVILKNIPQRLPPAYTLKKAEKESLLGFYRASNVRFGFSYWYEWLTNVSQVVEQDGKLMMKNLLDGATTPLRPVSANRFIRLNKKGYTTSWALVRNDEGQKVLTGGFLNMTETTALSAWFPIVLGGFALLMSVLSIVAGFIWLIRYGWLKRRSQLLSAMQVRMPLWGYSLSLPLFLGVTLVQVPANPFTVGIVGVTAVTIFVTSILTVAFAIWAFINLIRYRRQMPNRFDRAFLWIAVCSALLVVAYMAVWGLIGLRLWA